MRAANKLLLILMLCCVRLACGQLVLEESHTQASLRGLDSVGKGVAWASGTGGTVLRTLDGGNLWQTCTVPAGAEKLDFRGVAAFDDRTALVMASGKGALSGVYKTTDGCHSWREVLVNPDAEGFFDALQFAPDGKTGYLLGDPVDHHFVLYRTPDRGEHWVRSHVDDLKVAAEGIGGFAASNSALLVQPLQFGTSGPGGPYVYRADLTCTMKNNQRAPQSCFELGMKMHVEELPLAHAGPSAGVFSLAKCGANLVAVGGDYMQPKQSAGTAAYFDAHLGVWQPSKIMPGGYRSSVAYDSASGTCFAVGPNGVDLSSDDGVSWQKLGVAGQELSQGWNAVSYPFVVGAHGRIGRFEVPANPRR